MWLQELRINSAISADCNKFFDGKSTSNMFLTFTAVHLILFPAEWTQMEAACRASHLQMSVPACTGMFNQRSRFRRPAASRYLRWWCRYDFTTRSDVSRKGQKQCGVLSLLLAWKVNYLSRDLLKWRRSKICLRCQLVVYCCIMGFKLLCVGSHKMSCSFLFDKHIFYYILLLGFTFSLWCLSKEDYFFVIRLEEGIELLCSTGRYPEAAFMARTYLPSHVSK